ncbi:two-component system regulatory protein YycI [Metabacillus litoralis]|nr:two-component system regulatory protein YycI [Metabacillus litoralis]
MEWNKTKTIFILAFLILDIFLAIEFYKLQYKTDYEIMKEATIEEKLAVENITYKKKLPEVEGKSFYITAKSKEFTLEELPKNQTLVLSSSSNSFRSINMEFDNPLPIPETNLENRINQILKDHILYGDKYQYWYTDGVSENIICIQRYGGRNIFQSKDDHIGMVIFQVEKNQIVGYEQSLLEDIKEVEEKESAVPALKAIEALYNKNFLTANSEVKNIQYGYYTHIPLTNQQILAPTWHIIVETDTKETKDFYVNALEGDVLQSTQ